MLTSQFLRRSLISSTLILPNLNLNVFQLALHGLLSALVAFSPS